jgi:hypothetical protein
MHTSPGDLRKVTYYSWPNRLPYHVWERSAVPRISDGFTGIAVYIYESLEAAQEGDHFGASGFLATVALEDASRKQAVYVVTNKHVIKDQSHPWSTMRVIRLNRKDGTVECIPTTEDQWVCHEHGDDVAVFRLDVEWVSFNLASVDIKQFVTRQLIIDEDIGIGDDTVMVGRFINREGKQKNTPSVRFGNIAMMGGERIESEEIGVAQESFLVETRSLPGYSGSAVFIYSPCAMNDMSQKRFGRTRKAGLFGSGKLDNLDIRALTDSKGPYLLGIDWCHIHRRAMVFNRDGKEIQEKWYVEENTGMAGVVPAWKIAEVLNCEELMTSRKKEAEEFKARASGVSLDSAKNPQEMQVTPGGAEIPIPTQDQFLEDLTRASRRKGSE